MTKPSVLTVLLNYKTPEMTLEALATARIAMEGIKGEIVVVDNDSQDGSYEAILAHIEAGNWQNVRVIQAGHNGGFGSGNNVGIRAGFSNGTKPDYYYILNSDAFPAPGAIQHLIDTLGSNPKAGFAGSYIHGPSGEPHITAFRFPSVASELEGAARLGLISRLLGHKAVPLPLPEFNQPVDWLAGASMLMRRETLDQIGLFDERFFLYFEETDLCLRAHRAGWQVIYVRTSHVAHIGSVSTGMKNWKRVPEYWFDSRLYYFTKNHGHVYAGLATAAHVLGALIWRLKRVVKRGPRAEPPQFLRNLLLHYIKSPFVGRTRARRANSDTAKAKRPSRTGG